MATATLPSVDHVLVLQPHMHCSERGSSRANLAKPLETAIDCVSSSGSVGYAHYDLCILEISGYLCCLISKLRVQPGPF